MASGGRKPPDSSCARRPQEESGGLRAPLAARFLAHPFGPGGGGAGSVPAGGGVASLDGACGALDGAGASGSRGPSLDGECARLIGGGGGGSGGGGAVAVVEGSALVGNGFCTSSGGKVDPVVSDGGGGKIWPVDDGGKWLVLVSTGAAASGVGLDVGADVVKPAG